jgi:hypothetical protein
MWNVDFKKRRHERRGLFGRQWEEGGGQNRVMKVGEYNQST